MDRMTDDELPEPLARAMKALDARAARAAGRVDPARASEAVLRRLKQAPAGRDTRPWWAERWVRVAAAIAVLAAGGALGWSLSTGAGNQSAGTVPVPFEAESLNTAQGEALLLAVDGLPAVGSEAAPAAVFTVYDLNETELQSLLESMESSEGTL